MKISYAILTHNEGLYIKELLCLLVNNKRQEDEIIIVDDHSTDPLTLEILNDYKPSIKLFHRVFDGDASQKNYLNSLCTGDYICQLDSDELLKPEFIQLLPSLLENNSKVELFRLPRINRVEDLTQEYIQKWGWRVDNEGRVNYPDFQDRLFANKPEIKWEGLLHSKMSGYKTFLTLPYDNTDLFCIIHNKKLERQVEQNNLYDKIEQTGRTKYKV